MSLTQPEMDKLAEMVVEKLQSDRSEIKHWFQEAIKAADDIFLMKRIEDTAFFDKVRTTGPPTQYQPNPTALDAGNRLIFSAYTFVPRTVKKGKRYPLIVWAHGGIHSNFNSEAAAIIRELIAQEYIIIAPEYRGSTGYGRSFYERIDYGGLESEDTYEARNYMLENCEFVDPGRVGIIGWSHGGMHVLFNIFNHPEAYQAAYCAVPVSDLVARLSYKRDGYRKHFEAEYHIGQSVHQNVKEYQRRSPAWNAKKLFVPLLIHTTENDQDVNVLEVRHLVQSLMAAGNKPDKDFHYKIYPATPGAHGFNRLDTRFAKGVRGEFYDFLAIHLKPPKPNPLKEYIGSPNPLDHPDKE